MNFAGCQAQCIGIDTAILFLREKNQRRFGEPADHCSELKRRLGRPQSVTWAKLLCSQEVSHGGDNRAEKNADRGLTLEEKLLQQIKAFRQFGRPIALLNSPI